MGSVWGGGRGGECVRWREGVVSVWGQRGGGVEVGGVSVWGGGVRGGGGGRGCGRVGVFVWGFSRGREVVCRGSGGVCGGGGEVFVCVGKEFCLCVCVCL